MKLKRLLFICSMALLMMIVFMGFKATFVKSRQVYVENGLSNIHLDQSLLNEHLSQALRFKTISSRDRAQFDYSQFDNLYHYLELSYPNMHAQLKRKVINSHSLLYEWTGTDVPAQPVILTAHMDVVPVSDQKENRWKYGGFSGAVAEGYIWGRGAVDCKGNMIGIYEAVEYLLKSGFRPKRTIYLAFGHDEEVGGLQGAAKIAAYLESQGIEAEYVLDEGGYVIADIVDGLEKPVAMIGTAEKGSLSLELTVMTEGGHSSTPPKETAVGILSRAVTKLENDPFPKRLEGSTREMFNFLAPEMGVLYRVLFSNLWISEAVLKSIMELSPSTAASIQTTAAVTIYEAGIQDNVLPDKARAVVNFRMLHGDSIKSVTEYVNKILDDPRIQINQIGYRSEASPISSTASDGFKLLQKTIKQIFPKSVSAPYLLLGMSDARHYAMVAKDIYRFAPISIREDELTMIHGVNERVSTDNLIKIVQFYIQFISDTQAS